MKKKRLHAFTLIIGSILATTIAFSQFFQSDFSSVVEKVKSEQSQNNSGNETESFISLPTFSLPAPVNVEVNLNPYCLFEIYFAEDVEENQTADCLLYPDRFFKTMFRVIISPNAP